MPGQVRRNPAVTEHLPDGSYLARLDDLPVRMIDAQVTMTGTDGSRAADAYLWVPKTYATRRYS